MSSRYKPYSEYKSSNIGWLDNIPAHWDGGVIKRGYNVCLGKMLRTSPSTDADTEEPYLRAANLDWFGVRVFDIKKMWVSPDEKIKLRLSAGDLLISEGGDVGRCSIWANELPECYIQNAVNRVRGKGDNSTRFLYYWVYTIKQHGLIDVICNKSTIAHYTAEKVAETECLLPPLSEQRAIAAFLDRETGKIDRMIGKQERMIELLKEKRQAVISNAVTKGLNPNAPMKDSGIEWLGDIPKHWDTNRLKFLGSFTAGYSFKSGDFTDSGVPVVKITNIQTMAMNWEDVAFLPEHYLSVYKDFSAQSGDLVFALTRPIISTGIKAAYIEELEGKVLINQRNAVFKQTAGVNKKFVYFTVFSDAFFGSFESRIDRTGQQPNISTFDIAEISMTVPPEKEQNEIVQYLEKETAKIDNLIAKAEQAIDLMKERRTALISAAVTGKIDVRSETGIMRREYAESEETALLAAEGQEKYKTGNE